MRVGGHGPKTTLLCGGFALTDPVPAQIMTMLPPLLKVGSCGADGSSWIEPVVELIRREASHAAPGAQAVFTRLADVLLVQAASTARRPARTGQAHAFQQLTMTGRFPATLASLRRSPPSLVKIRSPGEARSTTVASIASAEPAFASRTPAALPSSGPIDRTSTARSNLARFTCRPPWSRHTCATTIALLRNSRPRRWDARILAIVARSSRSAATNAPTSRMSAVTRRRLQPQGQALAQPALPLPGSRRRALPPIHQGIQRAPRRAACWRLPRPARMIPACRPGQRPT